MFNCSYGVVMERIKHIWYDSSVINTEELEQKLQSLQYPFFRMSKNNLLVQANIASSALYNQLGELVDKKSIFIGSFDSSDYWGFMNGELWNWIKEH